MHYPDKKRFLKLAKPGNIVPVYREILADFDTPLSAYSKIDLGDYSFLLESIEGGERIARYSFLGSQPSAVFSVKGRTVEIRSSHGASSFMSENPMEELRKFFGNYRAVKVKGLPRFTGGLVGFLGYDMVRFMEEIPDNNPDTLDLPDSVFMLTDTILVFDHVDHKIKVVSNVRIDGPASAAYDEAVHKIDAIVGRLKARARTLPGHRPIKRAAVPVRLRSNLTRSQFESSVRKAKSYIRNGDIIQVVLSQRLETPVESHPFEIYRALRSVNPSPYMYCLKLRDFYMVGSSPEIMVRCEDGNVEVRPIAGTRPRGLSEKEDDKLAKELLADPKERAEHIMLVDLGRNDIGRVCDYKSVKVSELMTIEKYSHVMHIVTDVSGRLKKGK
ncbi:MAG: chorismate-binding protein, partial [Candidatus Omnitrophica bacterium]|nr:chorismate-binding protein [Candidatus Omnitrophota bacterium]